MGGHRQRKTRGQDEHLIYRAATLDLADALGCEHRVIYSLWAQIALAREFHGEPRAVAEWMAWRNVQRCFEEQESD